jgi:hypothetical protein
MDKLGIDYLTPAIIAEAARIPFEDALRVRDNLIEIHHWTRGEEDIIRAPRRQIQDNDDAEITGADLRRLTMRSAYKALTGYLNDSGDPRIITAAMKVLPLSPLDKSELEKFIGEWREGAINSLRAILVSNSIDIKKREKIEKEFRDATRIAVEGDSAESVP